MFMLIAIFSSSLQCNNPSYRGLYRLGFASAGWLEHLQPMDTLYPHWEWYVNHEDSGLPYTSQNLQRAKDMCSLASARGYYQDLILYGEADDTTATREVCGNVVLLGYDVCGDAMYYSYLGDAVFNVDPHCLTPCWRVINAYFAPRLNEDFLFGTLEDAQLFAKLQDELSRVGYGEGESNWRPFAIYSVKDHA